MRSSNVNLGDKITLPNKPGPDRKHYCPEHKIEMKPVKLWGKGIVFMCKEGCELSRRQTDLK